MRNCGCNDYSRTAAAAPRRRRGGPRPAGHRARHAAARGHRAEPALVLLALRRPGAGGLRGRDAWARGSSRRASRRPPAQAPATTCSCRSSSPAGLDSLTMLAPKQASHPQYAALRPDLALAERQGTDFADDPRCAGIPSLAGLATLHGEGKVTVLPGDRLHRPRTSRTSRAATTGRSARSTRSAARAGSAATSTAHGSADNPLQGLTLGWDLQPALAAATCRSRRSRQPDELRLLGQRRAAPSTTRMLDAFDATWATRRRATSAWPGAHGGGGHAAACASSSPPFNSAITLPAVLPEHLLRPRGSRWIAKLLEAGLPLQVVALESGGYDTHANQLATLPADLQEVVATRCSPSSATSRRAASPTACSCTCGASSAAARRRTRAAPTTARRASAS